MAPHPHDSPRPDPRQLAAALGALRRLGDGRRPLPGRRHRPKPTQAGPVAMLAVVVLAVAAGTWACGRLASGGEETPDRALPRGAAGDGRYVSPRAVMQDPWSGDAVPAQPVDSY
jgi:hypothetical protein